MIFRKFDEDTNHPSNIIILPCPADKTCMVGSLHCATGEGASTCEDHGIIFCRIREMFCIIVFMHHIHVNRHDDRVAAVHQTGLDSSGHVLIKVEFNLRHTSSTAKRSLDMQIRRGDGSVSRALRGDDLGTAG